MGFNSGFKGLKTPSSKIVVSFEYDKNSGTLHEGQTTFLIIPSYNKKCFRDSMYRKSKHIFYVQ